MTLYHCLRFPVLTLQLIFLWCSFLLDQYRHSPFPLFLSHTLVLFTILKKKSLQGIRKAFSTCGAHLLSVSLYYGPLLFMYVLPGSAQENDQNMMDSLFYTVIIPFLNPIIYSLRNKKVIDSLTKMLKRNV